MRSIAFADFLIGVGILFVLEGLLFAASPAWMRRAMKSALATPDHILRVVGIGSAVAGLVLIGRSGAEQGNRHSGMVRKHQTSDVQLHIGDLEVPGSALTRRPGMTTTSVALENAAGATPS